MSNSIQLELTHSVTVVKTTIWVQKSNSGAKFGSLERNKLETRITQLGPDHLMNCKFPFVPDSPCFISVSGERSSIDQSFHPHRVIGKLASRKAMPQPKVPTRWRSEGLHLLVKN